MISHVTIFTREKRSIKGNRVRGQGIRMWSDTILRPHCILGRESINNRETVSRKSDAALFSLALDRDKLATRTVNNRANQQFNHLRAVKRR